MPKLEVGLGARTSACCVRAWCCCTAGVASGIMYYGVWDGQLRLSRLGDPEWFNVLSWSCHFA